VIRNNESMVISYSCTVIKYGEWRITALSCPNSDTEACHVIAVRSRPTSNSLQIFCETTWRAKKYPHDLLLIIYRRF